TVGCVSASETHRAPRWGARCVSLALTHPTSHRPRVSAMFTFSAFADEISPDPQEQVNVLKSCGVRHIEFRSILKTNVLALTDLQVREFKSLLDQHGFQLSAIGSPIGKTVIDQPFDVELKRLYRAIELCHLFGTRHIRVF